jgi:hypothetical protein
VIVARLRILMLVATLLALVVAWAHARTYKYEGGPRAPDDTVLSVAQTDIEPIVRSRGPRVPATNLELVELVARRAIDQALKAAPLDSGAHVLVAPAESHPLNFMMEHAVLLHLARRGATATVRRSIIPDDSLVAIAGNPGDPVLEYSLASARVTYLRLVGWLPGRVRIERQGLVQGTLTLRDPLNSRVLWTGDASGNLVDRFPKGQLPLVEDQRYTDLKSAAPTRNVDKVFEPIVVVAVVVGLVALFFQNRP